MNATRRRPSALDALCQEERAFARAQALPQEGLDALDEARARLALEEDDVLLRVALWVAAPCLAAFALWARRQAGAGPFLFVGVMREGRFLARLIETLCHVPTRELWVNRSIALRAAFGAGDEEALENWLARTRVHPLSRGQAEEILTGGACETSSSSAQTPLDCPEALKVIAQWRENETLPLMRQNAQHVGERLLRHWDRIIAESEGPIYLLDFACAGNIQRSLRTLFLASGREDRTIGLNVLTTKGACHAQRKGAVCFGFMAENGAPEWIGEAYARSPEVLELFAASPLGPLLGHSPTGEPEIGPSLLTTTRRAWLALAQERILKASLLYVQVLGDALTADLARLLWGRLLLAPSQDEALALGCWPLDCGLESTCARELAPPLSHQEGKPPWGRAQTAWPLASALRATGRRDDGKDRP